MSGHHSSKSYCILILIRPYFHIPMSSSIEVSSTPPTTLLIALPPQSLEHPFRNDMVRQMKYFPTPLVEE